MKSIAQRPLIVDVESQIRTLIESYLMIGVQVS